MTLPLTALLSAVLPFDEREGTPRGYQDILGSSLLLRQLSQIKGLGIQRCIIAVEAGGGALDNAIARAEYSGLHIDIVQNPQQFSDLIDAQQDVLVLGDGMYVDPMLLRELTGYGRPFIAVIDDAPENTAHERIDINHLWAGIARVPGAIAKRIHELPDDWNIESALLRYGAQAGLSRQRIAQASLDSQAILLVSDPQHLHAARALLLHGTGHSRPPLSERLFLNSLSDAALPLLSGLDSWKRGMFVSLPIFCALASLICAYMGWTSAMCISGLMALIAQKLSEREQQCCPFFNAHFLSRPLAPAFVAAALVLHAFYSANFPQEALGLALSGGLMYTAWLDWNSDVVPRLWPDPPVALALLLVGALTGLYVWSLWVLTLLLLALAIARARGRRKI